jgi:hypothetical protein
MLAATVLQHQHQLDGFAPSVKSQREVPFNRRLTAMAMITHRSNSWPPADFLIPRFQDQVPGNAQAP